MDMSKLYRDKHNNFKGELFAIICIIIFERFGQRAFC